MGRPILLTHDRAPGDIVCMTACIRDLARTHPEYDIYVNTSCSAMWKNNPYIRRTGRNNTPGMQAFKLDYGKYITKANTKPMHFISAFHADLSEKIGQYVPVLEPHGDLHLSDYKKQNSPIDGRYWYIITGGKSDFTCKIWSALKWQQTVDMLRQFGIRFVQDGALFRGHTQPPMTGVLNVVGKTNLRDMLWMIYHADGVICHVTAAAHIAAALHTPCVVIAGGREHWWWEAYCNVDEQIFGPHCKPHPVPHRFLHTLGLLPCCERKGCWQNKVSKLEQDKHRMYCKSAVYDDNGQLYPKCLDMIQPEHVVEAVMDYYKCGTLPPIGDPPRIRLPDGKEIVAGTLSQTPTEAIPPRARAPAFLDLFQVDIKNDTHAGHAANKPPTVVNKFEGLNNHTLPVGEAIKNKIIGGRVTICILMYGNYFHLHKQCLNSILSTTQAEHRQIRIACNEVCSETLQYLSRLKDQQKIHKIIVNQTNMKKYPAMRQLFYDQDDPITDKWIIWFDDDSIANKDAAWLDKLCKKIVSVYANGARIVGAEFYWKLSQAQVSWIRSRPWYHNRLFQTRNGNESPNGEYVQFPAGGFWAIARDVVQRTNIPDPEIGQNGGAYMIGEQLWQAGYHMGSWNNKNQFIATSSAARRGLEEIHTGDQGWQPGGVFKKMHS